MINFSSLLVAKLRYCLLVPPLLCGTTLVNADVVKTPAEQSEGIVFLKKMQDAAKQLDYMGVFVYQQDHFVRTSRITHIVENNNELEKLEVLDGHRREYIRKNDVVTRYSPDTKKLLIEKRFTNDVFPAILVANPQELSQYYEVITKNKERVAGLPCQVILLKPIDKLRYGYRLCSDDQSGLLLQAQTIDESSKVIEQIFFTEINIAHIDIGTISPSFKSTDGWKVEHALVDQVVDLPKWHIDAPEGFKQIQAVKHVLSKNNHESAVADKEVWQIVFSDGLAAISVFIEHNDRAKRSDKVIAQGAMHIMGHQIGKYWVMVMGEAPEITIKQLVNSIKLLE